MDFEEAATLHRQWEKVKAAAKESDPLVAPITRLRGVVVQAAARRAAGEGAAEPEGVAHHEEAALFLLEHGRLAGPERMSTLGVRAVREQTSVGSSLFAQPLMLQAVPLGPGTDEEPRADQGDAAAPEGAAAATAAALSPEDRATRALAALETRAAGGELDLALLSDHLALLRRWYYRPEKQRTGEFFLPNDDGSWPLRRMLRGAARVVLGDPKPMQETDREGARVLKTKVLHAGREGVERVVPALSSAVQGAEVPRVFRSRRKASST